MNKLHSTLLAGIGTLSLLSVSTYALSAKSSSHPLAAEPTGHAAHQTQVAKDARIKRPGIKTTKSAAQTQTNLWTYTVQPSDTLWDIARGSGVTVTKLQQMNHMGDAKIVIGQHLRVPKRYRSYLSHARPKQAKPIKNHGSTISGGMIYGSAQDQWSMSGVPSSLVPLYKAAGSRYGIPWTVLAAIHKTETDFTVYNSPVSSEGAVGPMQFLPATFESYGVAAPGHQKPDVYNVEDAVYTAAHMLAEDGYAASPSRAIYAYNHSNAYVHRILELARI